MDEEHYGDVDGIDGDDGDAAVDDDDRCLGLHTRRRMKMDPSWASSPSRSLPKVRFLRLLVSLYVVSLIQLHGARLFEAAAPSRSYTAATIRAEKIAPAV